MRPGGCTLGAALCGDASALAALLPRASLATVPGDHGGTMRSAAFADSVLAFLVRSGR